MAIAENTLPIQLDRDFFDSEIDRLIHSAKNRIEQQRIHLKELGVTPLRSDGQGTNSKR